MTYNETQSAKAALLIYHPDRHPHLQNQQEYQTTLLLVHPNVVVNCCIQTTSHQSCPQDQQQHIHRMRPLRAQV